MNSFQRDDAIRHEDIGIACRNSQGKPLLGALTSHPPPLPGTPLIAYVVSSSHYLHVNTPYGHVLINFPKLLKNAIEKFLDS